MPSDTETKSGLFGLVIHGGAGARPEVDYALQSADMAALIARGQRVLLAGATALDVVADIVEKMEASGLYVAGKGSSPNSDGVVELDASIMDGHQRRAGAVAAVPNIVHPIRAALRVLESDKHVLLAGEGAHRFALSHGVEAVNDPDTYYEDHIAHGSAVNEGGHGTVGAVALDVHGNLASATSTGGLFNKVPGRVGDTPLIGAGTWADRDVAVSCTGIGEAFIRASSAHDLAARVRYGGDTLDAAAWAVLDEVATCGGDGGLIAIDRAANITMPFNSKGMKRAAVSSRMDAVVRVFEPEARR